MRGLSSHWPALLMLVAPLACGDGVDIVATLSGPHPATIARHSGDEGTSKAGESVTFRVLVTDERDDPVERVRVEWDVTAGEGLFISAPPNYWPGAPGDPEEVEFLDAYVSLTNQFGVASAYFVPTRLGQSTVAASAVGGTGTAVGSVTFSTTADTLVIAVGEVAWDATWPAGPQGVQVDAGTPIEWVLEGDVWWGPFGRVRSVSVPAGAQEFESPLMDPEDRFHFTPTIAGVWEWVFDEDGAPDLGATLWVR